MPLAKPVILVVFGFFRDYVVPGLHTEAGCQPASGGPSPSSSPTSASVRAFDLLLTGAAAVLLFMAVF